MRSETLSIASIFGKQPTQKYGHGNKIPGKKIPLNHKNVHFNKNKIPVRICVLYFQDGICNGSFRKGISQFQVKKLDTEYYHNKNHHKERRK
jgi:hypothetical protein